MYGSAAIFLNALPFRSLHAETVDQDQAAFLQLSKFLTGRSELDPSISARAHAQLRELDPVLDTKLSALSNAIETSGAKTMDVFLATGPGADLKETATTVVSAWYLGYTGNPDLSKMADGSKFLTYREALMFQPTIDVSIIPTFSRGKTGFWAAPPSTISTD